MMNDIERYNFWHSEIEPSVMCIHCGSNDTRRESELEYDDGADESNTSNHLVTVYYYVCNKCGDITHTHDYSSK